MKKMLVLFAFVFLMTGAWVLPLSAFESPRSSSQEISQSSGADGVVQARRGGGGFKSIKNYNMPARTTGSTSNSGGGGFGYGYSPTFYSPGFLGFSLLPFAVFGGHGDSMLSLILMGLLVFWIISLFFKRRGRKAPTPDQEDSDEIGVLYDRCKKNMDYITEEYLKCPQSLEVLKGKLPDLEWQDWNDDFSRINLAELEAELAGIKVKIDEGRLAAARPMLYSFDEDAEETYKFLEELNDKGRAFLKPSA